MVSPSKFMVLLLKEDLVVSLACSATLFTISFRLIESIGIQEFFNSWFTTFFKESISIFLAFFFVPSSKFIKLASFFIVPFLSSLNLVMVLESPRIKKKIIETVK